MENSCVLDDNIKMSGEEIIASDLCEFTVATNLKSHIVVSVMTSY